jgi:hypothetical protein
MSGVAEAAAQDQVGCFRGRPQPACKTFWIVELQGLIPMAQTTRTVQTGGGYTYEARAFEEVVEWNIGHMVNVGDRYAVGGVLTVGSGGADPLTGVRLRGRRWLTEDLSLEIEGGLLRTDAGGFRWAGVNGWTADVRLNIRDQGSFFLRYDGVNVPEQTYPWSDAGYSDPGGLHHGLSLGATAGSVPALVGTGAMGLLYAVMLAIYIGND